MNIETLREFCISQPAATEGFPFGEETLVFKVGGKIFLLIGLDAANRFNVKCDPELAVELREQHNEVKPGFHMNKTHWNTVYLDGTLTDTTARYDCPLVPAGVKKLTQKVAGSNCRQPGITKNATHTFI